MAANTRSRSRSRSRTPAGAPTDRRGQWPRSTPAFRKWAAENLKYGTDSAKVEKASKRSEKEVSKYFNMMLKGEEVQDKGSDTHSYSKEKAERRFAKFEKKKNVQMEAEQERGKAQQGKEELTCALPSSSAHDMTISNFQQGKDTLVLPSSSAPDLTISNFQQGKDTLVLPASSNPLNAAMQKVQEELAKSIEREDTAISHLGDLTNKKKELDQEISRNETFINFLQSAAKKVPSIKQQIQEMKEQCNAKRQELAEVGVHLNKAKDNVNTARADVKKMEKEESALQAMVYRDVAESKQHESPPETATDLLDELFEIMDRTSSGKVNKRDFIKSLEHEKVAGLLGLPSKIKPDEMMQMSNGKWMLPEDDDRDRMETVFRKIANNGNDFDITEFKAAYENAALPQSK